MSITRSISREIGTAFAVLAVYLLTVLAPLHHARASQLSFEQLGYAAIEASWVACTPAGAEGQDRDQTIAKCPATGVAKGDLVLPALATLPADYATAPMAVLFAASPVAPALTTAPPAGPRAPPVLV